MDIQTCIEFRNFYDRIPQHNNLPLDESCVRRQEEKKWRPGVNAKKEDTLPYCNTLRSKTERRPDENEAFFV